MNQPPDDPFFKPAIAQANANLLLPLCNLNESAILLDTAYRRRLRKAPDEVADAAAKRFAELFREKEWSMPDDTQVVAWSYLNLADLLWNRMSEEDQYQWLLKVT